MNVIMVGDELGGAVCPSSQRSPCRGTLYTAADRIRQRLGKKPGGSRLGPAPQKLELLILEPTCPELYFRQTLAAYIIHPTFLDFHTYELSSALFVSNFVCLCDVHQYQPLRI
ncbi:unnamed protein product [Sphacelaria rigidula]